MDKKLAISDYEWKYTKQDLKYCPRCGSAFTLEDIHIPNQPQLVCHACEFIFYLEPKLVVMALVRNKEKLLLLQRAEDPGQGKWALLAGHVERGEDPYQALQREAYEETALAIHIDQVLKVNSFPSAGMVQIIFVATTEAEKLILNSESVAGKFFARTEIPWAELAFASTAKTLREYYRELEG